MPDFAPSGFSERGQPFPCVTPEFPGMDCPLGTPPMLGKILVRGEMMPNNPTYTWAKRKKYMGPPPPPLAQLLSR